MKMHATPAPVFTGTLARVPPPVHKPFCFAGQPAPCPGYFENDILPCVCGAPDDVLAALAQVQIPATPVETACRDRAPRRRRRSGRLEKLTRLLPRHAGSRFF
jgi:hypothetical protein